MHRHHFWRPFWLFLFEMRFSDCLSFWWPSDARYCVLIHFSFSVYIARSESIVNSNAFFTAKCDIEFHSVFGSEKIQCYVVSLNGWNSCCTAGKKANIGTQQWDNCQRRNAIVRCASWNIIEYLIVNWKLEAESWENGSLLKCMNSSSLLVQIAVHVNCEYSHSLSSVIYLWCQRLRKCWLLSCFSLLLRLRFLLLPGDSPLLKSIYCEHKCSGWNHSGKRARKKGDPSPNEVHNKNWRKK